MGFVSIYIPGRELPTECHAAIALLFFGSEKLAVEITQPVKSFPQLLL